MTPDRSVADRVFDVLVYAPIGAIADAQSHLVQLAARGRGIAENRVRVAKIVGQFAVDRGRKEVTKLLDHAPSSQVAPTPAPMPVASAGAVRQHDAEASGVLAIADYDALAASQVVSRLEGLTTAERDAIRTYETAHRARRTILGKLAQLDERTDVIVAARRAVSADLDVVADLTRSFVEDLRPLRGGRIWAEREAPREPVGARLAAAIDDPANLVLVGALDDVVVGYCMTHIETLPTGTRLGRLSELFVEPDAREVGVGETMLGFVVDWCRENGCVGVDGVVLPGMRTSKNFFETAGFVARAIVVHHPLELGGG